MNGHGGARPGAGRKPTSLEEKVLKGTATLGERRQLAAEQAKQTSDGGLPTVPMPKGMSKAEQAVWVDLSPHALIAGTLTAGTSFAFRALCELIVLRRLILRTITREGWQRKVNGVKKKHPLATEHRGLLQREEAGLARFCVAPVGKEMEHVIPPAPGDTDPFDDFDEPSGTH